MNFLPFYKSIQEVSWNNLHTEAYHLSYSIKHTVLYANDLSHQPMPRSSRTEVFCRKGILRNFAKFTGKHLHQSLWHMCFPVNFAKFLRTTFFTGNLRRLPLNVESHKNMKIIKSRISNINLFHTTGLLLYPLENSKKPNVFRGYSKRIVTWNWLN